MTDPVAEKSAFLKMYMSNHPDTLVAYAKWFGKVKEVITSAEMSAIDCNVRVARIAYGALHLTIIDRTEYDVVVHSQERIEEGRASVDRTPIEGLRGR